MWKSHGPGKQAPKRVRLLIVTSLFPPTVGGAAEYFRINFAQWEHHNGIDGIVVLTERQRSQARIEVKGKGRIWRLLPPRDSKDNPGRGYRALSLVFTWLLIFSVTGYLALFRHIDICLVHCRYGRRELLSILKLLPVKVIVILTDLLTEPRTVVKADGVICVCQSVFDHSRSCCPEARNLFHIPLPFEWPEPLDSTLCLPLKEEPFILYVGGVVRIKGVGELFRAFQSVRQTYPEYKLVIAGPLRDRDLCREAGDGIVLLGAVKHGFVLDLMRRAELVILPSKSEGLPRACLEAIALGKKVVCPPGVPEFQESCPQFVLSTVSEEHIAKKLLEVIQTDRVPTYGFANHRADVIAQKILEVCVSLVYS